ncbi:MAG: helix-turn-helix domain-containing protein [Actinomycetota bacterium]|nr:helix-turn-helix domain-containing protein [Actinomycetota bacterium]
MSKLDPSAVESPTSTRAVDRAMALLSEVCSEPSLTLSECARRTQLPASTALRLLRTLEGSGFVTRDVRGSFEAGPRMVQIGTRALSVHRILEIARPALATVVDRTGESAYLALPGPGRTAVYAAAHEGTWPIRHSSWIGREVGLDAAAVRAALDGQTDACGYVTSQGRLEPDITAVAAAVRFRDRILAVVTVLGPTYRLTGTALTDCGAVMADVAHDLEQQLGNPSTMRTPHGVRLNS